MTFSRAPRRLGLALCAVVAVGLLGAAQAPTLPARLSDAQFWKLVSDISEPDGYFRITDNYTSNEAEIGRLFTALRGAKLEGGVYIGVGPEQNLTYIAAIRPAMAFVIDIRRQAVMQHLMFKALFELSRDRVEFISLLFARPRPSAVAESAPIQQIWDAFFAVAADPALATTTRERIFDRLMKTHGFPFTEIERSQLTSVMGAFARIGPGISTRGYASGRGGTWTFADLTGWSSDDQGEVQSFLSTEEHFRTVKALHERNLIVPVSGDFGGSRALRGIGAYLREHRGVVRAFYVSNVEQYLFQDGKAAAFYDNVATLPLDDRSVFIRPYALRRSASLSAGLCPIGQFLGAVTSMRVRTNNEALACPQ
ncbi:MAG TPA: hypothetical protein VFO19_08240 [Vicinamibacterales bacterium]|nr:hypothetical protein [Vicinamibacterales bacterium]